jgi:hypothetical protein
MTIIDKRRLGLSPAPEITRIRFGEQPHHEALVVDGVYRDPGYVREIALSLDYVRARGYFPGFEARISIALADRLLEVVRQHLRPDLELLGGFDHDVCFSMTNETVAEKLRYQPGPHADVAMSARPCVAGLVYLNPPEQCRGGTAFYRHRESGACDVTTTMTASIADYIARHGIATLDAAYKKMVERPAGPALRDGEWGILFGSNDTWERLSCIDMRFNRFVAYDARIFHALQIQTGQFGCTDDTRRLTQTIFFEQRESRVNPETPPVLSTRFVDALKRLGS